MPLVHFRQQQTVSWHRFPRSKHAPVWLWSAYALLIASLNTPFCSATRAEEELPAGFPTSLAPGVTLQSTFDVANDNLARISQNLGGKIDSLSNSQLRVHGRPIQVNIIKAANENDAVAIQQAVRRTKPPEYCVRRGPFVYEFVGRTVDTALALKASYELGVVDKPSTISYEIVARVATVDQADYMSCNPLFNLFLQAQSQNTAITDDQFSQLTQRFTFGNQLVLRAPELGGTGTSYEFAPRPSAQQKMDDAIRYTFSKLPESHGVPYVTLKLKIQTSDTGYRLTDESVSKQLTSATSHWPVADEAIQSLARSITAHAKTNREKATSILEWLTPGKHIKYAGETGSRWGTEQVLSQRFGHCFDFADCFVTLARAAGIPTRQVAGWLYGSSGHVWAEYYDGRGWQQVDPTGGNQLICSIYHIPYFLSDDGNLPILYVAMPEIKLTPTPSEPTLQP